MKILLSRLRGMENAQPPTDQEVAAVIDEIDEDGDKKINAREFARWYYTSTERIMRQVQHDFDLTDETPVAKL